MAAKSASTDNDWFAVVLSVLNPTLIMGLVGSLAFFILDVGYRGEFIGQMRWTMFFFVFGAVLVARICLLMGNQYGGIYGIALGAATFAVSVKYVSGTGVLLSLAVIIVIALSAYFITRDCTWMERPDRVAPQGLAMELGDLWQLLPTQKGERRKRRHGLSIVWFALAAIPLFGLGQAMIPAGDQQRRWSAFQCMTIYIGCSLGLLLTTAMVSLRSYLQSRKLKMPPAMTAMWMGTGAVIILVTLIIGAIFPRPHSELLSLAGLQSPNRDANRVAPRSEKGGEGEGDPGADGKNNKNAKDGRNDRGTKDENAKQKSKDGKKGDGGDKSGKSSTESEDKKNGPAGDKNSKDGQSEQNKDEQDGPPKSDQMQSALEQIGNGLQEIVKWIAIVGVGLLVLFLLIRGWAGMSDRFRKWLEQLLSKKKKEVEPAINSSNVASETASRPIRSFASFENPFSDGRSRNDADLVRYSFAALEAWGREQGQARTADETPIEYARMVGETSDAIQESAIKLAGHLVRLEYSASHRTSAKVRDDLTELWSQMEVNAASEVGSRSAAE